MDVHIRPNEIAAVWRNSMPETGSILRRVFFANAGEIIDAVVPALRGTIADPEVVHRAAFVAVMTWLEGLRDSGDIDDGEWDEAGVMEEVSRAILGRLHV
jgi:hypothetical protein